MKKITIMKKKRMKMTIIWIKVKEKTEQLLCCVIEKNYPKWAMIYTKSSLKIQVTRLNQKTFDKSLKQKEVIKRESLQTVNFLPKVRVLLLTGVSPITTFKIYGERFNGREWTRYSNNR